MLSAVAVCGQRWQIAPDGRGIVWKVGSDIPHDDHIEMSGERMAFVLPLGASTRAGRSARSVRSCSPCCAPLPNNTHASLMYRMAADIPLRYWASTAWPCRTNGSGRWPSTVRWRCGAAGASVR